MKYDFEYEDAEARSERAQAENRESASAAPAWSDAGYIPSADAAAMPKCYRTAPPSEKKARKRGGGRAVGVIAACLVCALLGGVAGGVLAPKLIAEPDPPAAAETVKATASSSAAAAATGTSGASAAVTPAISSTAAPSGETLSATDIYYNMAVNQVVAITTEITYTNYWGYTTSGAVKGSGFIISEDGYIMTNYHVIEDAVAGGYDIEVLMYDGTKYTAAVVGYAADNDVAVLKIEASGLSPVTIGNSDSMLVGEAVYAVGNPLGELEFTMTDGMVSATDREITSTENGRTTTINMFQFSAAINSGNSGGPVYNSRGEVVGIATAKYSSTGVEGLGFAIPINDAISIATELITTGHVSGAVYLGILKPSTLDASSAQYYGIVPGVYFQGIEPGSAAEKAGLKVGDIIVGLGGKEIADLEDLTSAKRGFKVGDTTTLRVYRAGEYMDLSITFAQEMDDAAATSRQQAPAAGSQSGGSQSGGDSPNGGSGYDPFYDYFYDFFGGNPFGTR